MNGVTINQLRCFDAVVSEGGFQAAATKLRRTHSAVFTSIKNLESQLGLRLLDRDGYRVTLTDHGRSFHDRARVLLADLTLLGKHASQLAMGEEAELRIVLGDLCPLDRRKTSAWWRRRDRCSTAARRAAWPDRKPVVEFCRGAGAGVERDYQATQPQATLKLAHRLRHFCSARIGRQSIFGLPPGSVADPSDRMGRNVLQQ